MALHLNGLKGQTRPYGFKGYKDQKCGLMAHFMSKTVFERRGGENEEKI